MYVAVCPQMDCVRDHRKPNGSLGLSPSPILHGPSLLSEHDRHSSVSCDCLLAQRSRVKCYKVKGLSDGVSHAVPADAAVLAKGDEE